MLPAAPELSRHSLVPGTHPVRATKCLEVRTYYHILTKSKLHWYEEDAALQH